MRTSGGIIGGASSTPVIGAFASGGCQVYGDMEFVRLSNGALDPSQFVQFITEPATLVLAAIGLVSLATFARRRRRA